MGVVEAGGDPDLVEEPLGTEHGGQLGPQHLERDLAVVLEILGEIDRGHPALTQLALDPVAVDEDGSRQRGHVPKLALGGGGRHGREGIGHRVPDHRERDPETNSPPPVDQAAASRKRWLGDGAGAYCTAFIMSKIGRYIATTMPPTITPRTTIITGSMSAEQRAHRHVHLFVVEVGDLG